MPKKFQQIGKKNGALNDWVIFFPNEFVDVSKPV